MASNRLPLRSDGAGGHSRSDGGLVRALEPVLDQVLHWIGSWPTNDRFPPSQVAGAAALQPVRLPPELDEGYYRGYSNSVLWPWLHGETGRIEDQPTWWWAYQEVNRLFARSLALAAPRRALVWVHDYHLMLVPEALRTIRPDVAIGFFLHTPFPERVEALPRANLHVLLDGLLGADLIGFQTQDDLDRFANLRPVRRRAGLTATGGRRSGAPRLALHPASIDSARFMALAAKPTVRTAAATVAARFGHRRIVLGVDRLDYTKGLPLKLRAYERLLESGEVTPDTTVFVQVAIPSREGVGAQEAERQEVERLARRINARFGRNGGPQEEQAVALRVGTLDMEELVAHYLAADVLVACPRRDGMNLVAKEYCAVHEDQRGVLVLSPRAGAAAELTDAIVPEQLTPTAVADAVLLGLRLPAAEATCRMASLHRRVRRFHARRWANLFLDELDVVGPAARSRSGARVFEPQQQRSDR